MSDDEDPIASGERAPIDVLLDQCERIVQWHEHLRMDTPGDEALRLDAVATARRALDQCRAIQAGVTGPGDDELSDAELIAAIRERLWLPADANNDTVLGWLTRWLDDPLNRPDDSEATSTPERAS